MADEPLKIRDSDEEIKHRTPWKAAVLDAVTIGIYGIVWYYRVNKELAALGRARGSEELGTNPKNSLWAIFPGFLVIVPFAISGYNTGERVKAAQRGSGAGETINSIAAVVGWFVLFPIGIFYVQQELNKVWERECEGAPRALPGGHEVPAPTAGAPAPQPQAAPPPQA